jgi:hypothetical protein
MAKFSKTRGHHCWWLNMDGRPLANFDNESDVDEIIKLEETLIKVGKLLEETGPPVFITARDGYPVSHGPKGNYFELRELIKLVNPGA